MSDNISTCIGGAEWLIYMLEVRPRLRSGMRGIKLLRAAEITSRVSGPHHLGELLQ